MQTIGIGYQDFGEIISDKSFYIDKTKFIKEWWESRDRVTLITRPRRFGKTLNMNMLERFFSVEFKGQGDVFEGLDIWKEEKYRQIQGSFPVIFISFADVKETSFALARKKICRIIKTIYNRANFLLETEVLNVSEKEDFCKISVDMEDDEASFSLKALSEYLYRYYGKKVIILLDEYDTPMQEAYVGGYWQEMVAFIRNLLNSTFKSNLYLERAILTGITRVSKESVFSDLNNLQVVTTTSEKYSDSFGFTEREVFSALDGFGLSDYKDDVKKWYDGFTFGKKKDIYNPWSIINFIDKKILDTYWANTSSNGLVGKLIMEGNKSIKQEFETLLRGGDIAVSIDEQIVYDQLPVKKGAVWSLLLASGYLKVDDKEFDAETGIFTYKLALTNMEVRIMFEGIIRSWFERDDDNYNDFIKALLIGDVKAMNVYMNKVALATFSYFDTGKNPSCDEPERFYHGFVLGLMIELKDRYVITSNRESGFGRYDVLLEPKDINNSKYGDCIIIEFKVQDSMEEKKLSDTVNAALEQIEKKNYAALLVERGIQEENIRKYGFAFCGKQVLIGDKIIL